MKTLRPYCSKLFLLTIALNCPIAFSQDAGTFSQGRDRGLDIGSKLADNLYQSTVGSQGCIDLPKLKTAILTVVRKVRAPYFGSDQMVLGYYQGYTEALRYKLQQAQISCNESSSAPLFQGRYLGDLYGAVYCQAGLANYGNLSKLELTQPLRAWTGGDAHQCDYCAENARQAIEDCLDHTAVLLSEKGIKRICSEIKP